MRRFRLFIRLAILAWMALDFAASPAFSAAPKVVVTIKPVHSLAAVIMEGVAEPKLLLDGASSPHSYALKPSDGEALSNADAIVRVSENLEVFLNRALESLPQKARVIDLEQTPGLMLLPVRVGGAYESEDLGLEAAAHPNEEEDRDHLPGTYDVHFWLDPQNAIKIADYLAAQFSQIDPEHAAQYEANALKLKSKLAALDSELHAKLSGVSGKPFIVFHDVVQYMEKRYGLKSAGAITVSPEQPPGAKRLAGIREKIEAGGVVCVFAEPQFPPKLVQMLIEDTRAKQGALDEIGVNIPAGPDHYFGFMRENADGLVNCLRS
jgi:zinc transport system substrate-binding protein